MFAPIVPPPTDHHQFSTGHSTENGDNAKTVAEKINAGFKHVYAVMKGMGASLADEVETVAKSEFDALVHEMGEVQAELRNLKMMVQGLGFAGAKPAIDLDPDGNPATGGAPQPVAALTGVSFGTFSGEPVVTVKEVGE